MARVLCLMSLVIGVLVALLFGADFVMAMAGMETSAPLRGAHWLMDLGFLIFGTALAVMSWFTFREQR